MEQKSNKTLAIIGQGYVGLPLAMAAVDAGWKVIGVDNFAEKVDQINLGISPVEDISNNQLQLALSSGAYSASCDFSRVSNASVVAICVPTPLSAIREPDLTLLSAAASEIAPHISDNTLVISESTSFPGTLRDVIIPIFQSLKSKKTERIYFACAPERVNPGDVIWNQKNTPRLVGGINQESQSRALSFYRTICDEVVSVSSPEIAESAKLLENTFRLVNIALINQFTQLCSASTIDVNEVIDAAATKPYGFMQFRPGVGVGGHCIPIDPLYLTWWARQNRVTADLIEIADKINLEMPKYVAQRAFSLLNPLKRNPKILIVGVAYKSGLSDTRETPMKELRETLLSLGAQVSWHDPLVKVWEDTVQVEIDWECDLVILANLQMGMKIERILENGTQILDCTNTQVGRTNVTLL